MAREFDGAQIFVNEGARRGQEDADAETADAQRRRFREFLGSFRREANFIYRDAIRTAHNLRTYQIEVVLEDLSNFNAQLFEDLVERPAAVLPLLELAATDVASATLSTEEQLPAYQVTLASNAQPQQIRSLTAERVSKLVHVPGIVIAATRIRAKSTKITLRCKGCQSTREVQVRPGFGGVNIPRRCDKETACPLDPYVVVPDKTQFVDQQTLKLQEMPEDVPTGEVPRHLLVAVDRSLVGRAVPGTRVIITGVMSIFNMNRRSVPGGAAALRQPYLRAVGLKIVETAGGRVKHSFPPEEVEQMRAISQTPELYAKITKAIAPSIYGNEDVKRAIACLLFSGSRKRLPDGTRLRGDINVLLLGDPGVAKSQFLKFVEKVSPVGVYTSGKGSSAAGLTASVLRDPSTGEFVIEGGAMVLGDGGVVCVDEFDKMRAEDRVAIHEAMEQQTISVAKAGIVTVLNSRCSVLAAANPVFGRYDDEKTLDEQVDFQTTILSRFDMIFLLRDTLDRERDQELARFVLSNHSKTFQQRNDGDDSKWLKRYVDYARSTCHPRLSEEATEMLCGQYVNIRSEAQKNTNASGAAAIPITVRQLEAIVRIAESLAKMLLSPVATIAHVQEALRLFNVSTVSAARAGLVEGMITPEMQREVQRAEEVITKRVPIGSRVSHKQLLTELTTRMNFSELVVRKAIDAMVKRHNFEYRQQRLALVRIK